MILLALQHIGHHTVIAFVVALLLEVVTSKDIVRSLSNANLLPYHDSSLCFLSDLVRLQGNYFSLKALEGFASRMQRRFSQRRA
jgi:hypothetical protein